MSLSSRINSLATRIGEECKSIWAAINGKAQASHAHGNITNDGKIGSTANIPVITGTGGVLQAGAFGSSSGTFCQGNDSRLSDNRTPSDNSVTYGKLASGLTSRNTVSASEIDWDAGGVFTKTISGATTFTFSNLKLNKVITLVLTGNFSVTLPSYCKKISGTYDGTKSNYIQFHCTNATSSSEEVWFTISQQAT